MYADYLNIPSAPPDETSNSNSKDQCIECKKEIDQYGSYIKFLCGDMMHLKCLNIENISIHIAKQKCSACIAIQSQDWNGLTISDMNNPAFIKRLEKEREKKIAEKERRYQDFEFDSNLLKIGAMTKIRLMKKGGVDGVNIITVNKKKYDIDLLLSQKIKFSHFMEENIHIQAIHQIFNIKEFDDLLRIGFNSSHLACRSNESDELLVPLKDLCHLYKVTFKELSEMPSDSLTFIKLSRLEYDVSTLKALEFTAPNILYQWGGDKNVFKLFSDVSQMRWMSDFELTLDMIDEMGLSDAELRSMHWKRKVFRK